LTVPQITALLDAALRRPESELRTIRTGKNKGTANAKVRIAVVRRAQRTGVDRRMAYLLSIWTGLRRGELAQLQWRDVILDGEIPRLQLRAETTKSSRGDQIPLHPQMAEELRAYRPVNARPTDRSADFCSLTRAITDR
jgi:integrase